MRIAGSPLATLLCLSLAAAPVPSGAAEVREPPPAGSPRDFDFLLGTWDIANRRLEGWLRGSQDWREFPARSTCTRLLGSAANMDEFTTPARPGVVAMSLRLFDPVTGLWSIYWLDSRRPRITPPVVGGFSGDRGVFEGDDEIEGRAVRVRYVWSRIRSGRPRWEQALSADGGRTWETSWVMDLVRTGEAAR